MCHNFQIIYCQFVSFRNWFLSWFSSDLGNGFLSMVISCVTDFRNFQGFGEAEIQKKVNEYRKLLQSQVASGELDIDAEMDSRDTHVRAKAAIENRDRMRSALGIKDDFIDGTSFEKFILKFFCVPFSHKKTSSFV